MLTDIDILSIVLLESFGIVSFLLAVVFFKQSRKISEKQESLKKATTDEIRNWPCYSYKWVMRDSMKQKKLLALTPALVVFIYLIMALWIFYGPRLFAVLISSLGYVLIIALIGAATILLQTNAFEAYRYSRAIQKVAPDHLSLQDEGYMELAKEALENAIARFVIIGIIFVIIGPFIRQILDGSIYALVTYTRVIFQATESSPQSVLAVIFLFLFGAMLTVILLYLPELTGRTIFKRVKLLAQRIRKRWRKR